MLKGGLPTATTYYKKHKISKGETIAQSLKERFDYGQNPDKTEGGKISVTSPPFTSSLEEAT